MSGGVSGLQNLKMIASVVLNKVETQPTNTDEASNNELPFDYSNLKLGQGENNDVVTENYAILAMNGFARGDDYQVEGYDQTNFGIQIKENDDGVEFYVNPNDWNNSSDTNRCLWDIVQNCYNIDDLAESAGVSPQYMMGFLQHAVVNANGMNSLGTGFPKGEDGSYLPLKLPTIDEMVEMVGEISNSSSIKEINIDTYYENVVGMTRAELEAEANEINNTPVVESEPVASETPVEQSKAEISANEQNEGSLDSNYINNLTAQYNNGNYTDEEKAEIGKMIDDYYKVSETTSEKYHADSETDTYYDEQVNFAREQYIQNVQSGNYTPDEAMKIFELSMNYLDNNYELSQLQLNEKSDLEAIFGSKAAEVSALLENLDLNQSLESLNLADRVVNGYQEGQPYEILDTLWKINGSVSADYVPDANMQQGDAETSVTEVAQEQEELTIYEMEQALANLGRAKGENKCLDEIYDEYNDFCSTLDNAALHNHVYNDEQNAYIQDLYNKLEGYNEIFNEMDNLNLSDDIKEKYKNNPDIMEDLYELQSKDDSNQALSYSDLARVIYENSSAFTQYENLYPIFNAMLEDSPYAVGLASENPQEYFKDFTNFGIESDRFKFCEREYGYACYEPANPEKAKEFIKHITQNNDLTENEKAFFMMYVSNGNPQSLIHNFVNINGLLYTENFEKDNIGALFDLYSGNIQNASNTVSSTETTAETETTEADSAELTTKDGVPVSQMAEEYFNAISDGNYTYEELITLLDDEEEAVAGAIMDEYIKLCEENGIDIKSYMFE